MNENQNMAMMIGLIVLVLVVVIGEVLLVITHPSITLDFNFNVSMDNNTVEATKALSEATISSNGEIISLRENLSQCELYNNLCRRGWQACQGNSTSAWGVLYG